MILIVSRNIQDVDKKSQYNTFYFRSSHDDIKTYKKVYFENSFIDNIKANKELKAHSKKIFFLSAEDIETLINLTDREFKRDKRVSSITKSAKSLSFFLNQESIVKIDSYTDTFMKENDIMNVSQQLFRKLHYTKDITKEALFILNAYQTPPKNSTILKVNRYLTEATNGLLDIFKSANIIMLNAPTGVGKSHFSLLELPKHFKNIIIISPLRMVTDEHASKSNFLNFSTADKMDSLLVDLDSSYIAMTTDVLFNMNDKHSEILKERLDKCELIIFDEQHLIEDSKNFRHKVIATKNIIEKSNTKILYLSGTPIYDDTNIKSVVIKTPVINVIKYFNNPFSDINELKYSIDKSLEKGSVLFYTATKLKVDEVANALAFKNICTITSEQIFYNGDVITNISQIPNTDKVLYISTTKATTGLNINNLKAIYQYGTTYNTNTLIQLMARLREDGNYYYVKAKFENNQMVNFTNTAIGLTDIFENLKLESIQKEFHSKKFQSFVNSNKILLAENTANGFLKTYSEALKLMSAFGFGKFSKDYSDFKYETRNLDTEAIERAYNNSDNTSLKRDTDKTIVNFISGAKIEYLNDVYNLSFKIQLFQQLNAFDGGLEIITDEDKAVKVEKNREKKSELEIFHDNVCEKFDYIAPKALLSNFTNTELKVLNDICISIRHNRIKSLVRENDRLTALKCYLTPKKEIFKIILELMIKNNSAFISLKAIEAKISKTFIKPNRTKNHYINFLKELFTNDFFNNSVYEYKDRIEVEKVKIYNVVRVKREYSEEFKTLKNKKQRELYLKNLLKNVEIEIVDTDGTVIVPSSIEELLQYQI